MNSFRTSARSLLLLWVLLSACSTFPSAPLYPTLSARVFASEDAAQHRFRLQLNSNVPLVSAQLVFGADGGRSPINVAVDSTSTDVAYELDVSEPGLRLPRDVNELRYGWSVRAVNGESIQVSASISSTRLLPEHTPIDLRWQDARAGQIMLHYLPATPGERDIEWLKPIAEDSVAQAARALDTPLDSPLAIYLVPRVFWQGGAAFGDRSVFISYVDRPYTGVPPGDYFAHESAHALSQAWGNLSAAGGLLAEGIAVYATGGHYRPDVIDASAAAITRSHLFIPLSVLRRDFANQQHEIAYTESASFVKFLIDQYRLEKFRALMRRPNDWRTLYGKDFDALAQDWLASLRGLASPSDEVRRWELKVRYYDILRQYEERLDPDARRLPSVPIEKWDAALRQALHAPADAEMNRVVELMMGMAIDAIDVRQFATAEKYLDEVERRIQSPSLPDAPIEQEVRAIVRVVQRQDAAILDRDWDALRSTLEQANYPHFTSQLIQQAAAQPLWLRFAQRPARIVLSGDKAWLMLAQWDEPLDLSQSSNPNGQRWVIALRKLEAGWLMTGRWPDSPEVPMAHHFSPATTTRSRPSALAR